MRLTLLDFDQILTKSTQISTIHIKIHQIKNRHAVFSKEKTHKNLLNITQSIKYVKKTKPNDKPLCLLRFQYIQSHILASFSLRFLQTHKKRTLELTLENDNLKPWKKQASC